jgi:hypothetical protein
MKAQKQVSNENLNHKSVQITSMIEFKDLSNSQKRITSSLYKLIRVKNLKVVLSVEDLFHDTTGFELMEKEILESVCFLSARFIPMEMQNN